jgi:hypothetical protein
LVRCGFCPGASAAIRRVSRVPCKSCAAQRAACPSCRGPVVIDFTARSSDDTSCIVAFCVACEFAVEVA